MRFIRWQIVHMKCLVWFSLQNNGEFWMSSALKFARRYKDITSIGLHFERTHISVVVKAECNLKTPARNDRLNLSLKRALIGHVVLWYFCTAFNARIYRGIFFFSLNELKTQFSRVAAVFKTCDEIWMNWKHQNFHECVAQVEILLFSVRDEISLVFAYKNVFFFISYVLSRNYARQNMLQNYLTSSVRTSMCGYLEHYFWKVFYILNHSKTILS